MAHKTTKTKHPSLAREKKRSKLDLRQEKTQKKSRYLYGHNFGNRKIEKHHWGIRPGP